MKRTAGFTIQPYMQHLHLKASTKRSIATICLNQCWLRFSGSRLMPLLQLCELALPLKGVIDGRFRSYSYPGSEPEAIVQRLIVPRWNS